MPSADRRLRPGTNQIDAGDGNDTVPLDHPANAIPVVTGDTAGAVTRPASLTTHHLTELDSAAVITGWLHYTDPAGGGGGRPACRRLFFLTSRNKGHSPGFPRGCPIVSSHSLRLYEAL